ncbi:MAG TPA: helix-turn-helix transcriptional regulator, partial [Virgibacillus sp.]
MEGEIIKFYREKQNLTQAQLGEGICTTTHVSKIERGKTSYSNEIITLFSKRLSIDIQQEIDK